MLDLFAIFGKGGIVLWYFQEAQSLLEDSINSLIRDILLQERGALGHYEKNGRTLKFKLDNEFDLVFVVVYQNIVKLQYVDRLLTQTQLEFRERYKDSLTSVMKRADASMSLIQVAADGVFDGFTPVFKKLLDVAQTASKNEPERRMRTYEESEKSKKTLASMIERKDEPKKEAKKSKILKDASSKQEEKEPETNGQSATPSPPPPMQTGGSDNDEVARKRDEFFKKMQKGKKQPEKKKKVEESKVSKKPGKQARQWALSGKPEDAAALDFSSPPPSATNGRDEQSNELKDEMYNSQKAYVGTMSGELAGLDVSDSEDEIELKSTNVKESTKSGGGWFSAFTSLVGNRKLTHEDVEPALAKMRDALIEKNVAASIAEKLCESVASELEGRVLGTFDRVHSTVKESVRHALTQILSPRRRVDILRDVVEARRQQRPYVIVFCGVNGVGKSTNLAKITFWLNENKHRVLIAAGDTFRAGAVEQLRTHVRRLNALHPDSVHLYEQGYGKDPAAIAMHAISHARERQYDVVLVDTAGRMQDNEPLMRALTKLIKVNEPDLVLFVGEALVGNEAVDQLVKFNQALADHADTTGADGGIVQPRLIDGILLTKFDTIDDKVGAAISMTYITGQPIVFVGTGQTYKDLRNLNVDAVVHALLK